MKSQDRCNGREKRSDYRVYHVDGFDDFGNNGFARQRKRSARYIERKKMLSREFMSTPLRDLRKAGFTEKEIGAWAKSVIRKQIESIQQRRKNAKI